jgi:purine-binding chemotaxis protein CheW
MSESQSTNSEDNELDRALAAAFGEDSLDMFSDEDDDSVQSELGNEGDAASGNGDPSEYVSVSLLKQLASNEHDSPLIQYVKEISTSIYVAPNDVEGCSQAPSRFVLFEIDQDKFAIPLSDVVEIARCEKVTNLPATPAWLRGVTNLRGQILSTTDFRKLVQHKSTRSSGREKLIVVQSKVGLNSTAIVVDRVIGIRSSNGEASSAPAPSETVSAISNGVHCFDCGNAVVVDIEKFFSCEQMSMFA